ncbi:MAG: cupin domain-containing protein [Vulcanimicrobiaceae bacterium]
MTEPQATFIDRTGATAPPLDLWPSIVIPRERIDAEIDRLAALPRPAGGRRSSLIVHPNATAPGLGLAPGIRVSLDVLKPGERTKPIRHNSTQVNFCIRGAGTSIVGGRPIPFSQYDVWNAPSMAAYAHINDTDELQVRLTYSNAALLEKMQIHVVEEDLDESVLEAHGAVDAGTGPEKTKAVNPYGTFELGGGAFLMPYEKLISPDVVPNLPLFWPWKEVQSHLDKLIALGPSYAGRRLYLLYNPATGRTNGTTHSFFATMTIRPGKIVDRPHRHTAAAINYYFRGSGHSIVEGKRVDWKAGDLMLSAPGWAVHNHASHDEAVYELTIQDSPLNIAMESLLWQESLKETLSVLGAQAGFATNREAALAR